MEIDEKCAPSKSFKDGSCLTLKSLKSIIESYNKNIKDNNIFISNIKRLIGYKYSDIEESYYKQFSGVTIFNNNNNIGILINDVVYSPDEIMIYFLNYLKTLINNDIDLLGSVAIAANSVFGFDLKQVLPATQTIKGLASSTSVDFHISGVEIA